MKHRSLLPLASLVCLLTAVACGDDAPAPPAEPSGASGQNGQAGAAGTSGQNGQSGAAGAFVEPPPPTTPALPVLTPCPERWSEKTLPSGVVACEPGPLPDWACPPGWLPKAMLEGTPRQYNICEPPPLPESCPEGTMAVLGESACQPIGDPCPAGDFPEGLPTDKPVLFVKAGASGGDGSQGKPFATIGEAVQKAGKGTVVAIAKGLYPEAVQVGAGKDVTLWGACVSEVTIQGPAGSLQDATLQAKGTLAQKARLIVQNLTITGQRKGIEYSRASGKIEHVAISGSRGAAIHASGANLEVRSVEGRDTSNDGSKGGWGLFCDSGAQVEVEDTSLHHNQDAGVIATGASTSLTLTNVIVRDTQAGAQAQTAGWGLLGEKGAQMNVRRALIEENREIGVAAMDAKTAVLLDGVVIRNTRGAETGKQFGWGLYGEQGAQISAERTLLEQNHDHAVLISSTGTVLQMNNVAIRDTRSQESDLTGGRGLAVQEGAQAKVERTLFDHNRDVALFAANEGTSLELNDTIVENTQSQESDLTGGRGLAVQGGARVTVERALFDHNRDVAVFAAQEGTLLSVIDAVVRNTQGREKDGQHGDGLLCQQGAQATVERALFDHNHNLGAGALLAGTTLKMTDLIVQQTQSRESDDEYGIGLVASSYSSLSLWRALLLENRVAALLVQTDANASLGAVHLKRTVAGNFTPANKDGLLLAEPIRGVGDGLVVLSGSSVTATDLLSSDHQRAGLLFVDSSGTLTTTTSTSNQYGLVLRGSSQPSRDETCSFDGNETPILPDGDLPVPNAPLQAPPPLD